MSALAATDFVQAIADNTDGIGTQASNAANGALVQLGATKGFDFTGPELDDALNAYMENAHCQPCICIVL